MVHWRYMGIGWSYFCLKGQHCCEKSLEVLNKPNQSGYPAFNTFDMQLDYWQYFCECGTKLCFHCFSVIMKGRVVFSEFIVCSRWLASFILLPWLMSKVRIMLWCVLCANTSHNLHVRNKQVSVQAFTDKPYQIQAYAQLSIPKESSFWLTTWLLVGCCSSSIIRHPCLMAFARLYLQGFVEMTELIRKPLSGH